MKTRRGLGGANNTVIPILKLLKGTHGLTNQEGIEDYVMRSFYTGNDVIVGHARTNTLI